MYRTKGILDCYDLLLKSSFSFLSKICSETVHEGPAYNWLYSLRPLPALLFKIAFIFAHIISYALSLQSGKRKWIQQLAVSAPASSYSDFLSLLM